MNFPADLRYTKTDEWVRLVGKQATIGISDFAQQQLSDIVFVEVTSASGDKVEAGKAFASVESVKAASEVYMPAAGKIVAVNEELPSAPELINSDPYGKAWMVRVDLADPASLGGLMDAQAYQKYCEERAH